MTIDRVIYFKTFTVGMYWEKIGMEASLSEGENPKEALEIIQKQVQEFFDESHPNNGTPTTVKIVEPSGESDREGGIIALIEKCTLIPKPYGLQAYEMIANTNPKIKQAYERKLKQLQNGT